MLSTGWQVFNPYRVPPKNVAQQQPQPGYIQQSPDDGSVTQALARPVVDQTTTDVPDYGSAGFTTPDSGSQTDALAQALLQGASKGQRTPFEAVGNLAQLWAGNRAEDKYQKASKDRELAPYKSLTQALAGLTPDEARAKLPELLMQSSDPKLMASGIEMMTQAPQKARTQVVDGTLLEEQPGGGWAPVYQGAAGKPPTLQKAYDAQGNEVYGYFDPQGNWVQQGGAKSDDTWETITDEQGNLLQRNRKTGETKIVHESGLLPDEVVGQKKDIAAAGKSSISIGSQENQYGKTVGEGLGNMAIDIAKKAASAPGQLATLDRLDQLSQDPNFYSGTGAGLLTDAKKMLAAVAGDPSVAASNEAYQSLSNQVVLNKIGSLGTGISNADRSFIESISPRLSNTPEGNKLVIQTLRKMTMRDQEIAQIAADYRQAHGGQLDENWPVYLGQWAEQHPIFTAADQGAGASSPAPTGTPTPDGWTVLPGGVRIRVKP